MKQLAVSLLILALAGCVAAPEIKSTFNPAEAEHITRQGTATIAGQAFLRRNDGVVVYGAGSETVLVPASTYARERVAALYRGGKVNSFVPPPKNTDPRYEQMARRTKNDGEGRFTFDQVADGDYFVMTTVTWMAGDWRQGGNLMEPVAVRNGQNVNLIMTGQ
ncbi:MAG TPA: hypothetical protein VIZ90_16560 [Rhizobiaceae bacterium]